MKKIEKLLEVINLWVLCSCKLSLKYALLCGAVYRINRRGPRTEPCGTPQARGQAARLG